MNYFQTPALNAIKVFFKKRRNLKKDIKGLTYQGLRKRGQMAASIQVTTLWTRETRQHSSPSSADN